MSKTKVKRPTRDEFELEDLAERLVEAHREDSELVLTVWGYEETVQGRITEMDSRTKMVHVSRAGEMVKVPFVDIMNVQSPE